MDAIVYGELGKGKTYLKLGVCVHCGEEVWTSGHQGEPAECEHGIAHAQCVLDNGCKLA